MQKICYRAVLEHNRGLLQRGAMGTAGGGVGAGASGATALATLLSNRAELGQEQPQAPAEQLGLQGQIQGAGPEQKAVA